MNATERLLPLLENDRQIGPDRWIARCPAHDDRNPSLSITQVSDRALLKCWAGCEALEVVSAIGLSLADLFDSRRTTQQDLESEHQHRAAAGLERWRRRNLTAVCETLRHMDRLAENAAADLAIDPDSEAAWSALSTACHAITVLEYDLDQLNSKDVNSHLEVWREHAA